MHDAGVFKFRVFGKAMTLCCSTGNSHFPAYPPQHVEVVAGEVCQYAAVGSSCVERLGARSGRDLLRVNDHGLADVAKLPLHNRFPQMHVGRRES